MKNLNKKLKLFLLATIILSTNYTIAQQNFPHIKTFGFDYIRFQDNNGAFLDNLRWLANHHDWVVGTKGNWSSQGVDYLDALTYNTIKDENPNAKIMKYLPYHSIAPITQVWIEDWATNNGHNPEDLYYHYYYDTTINLANGNTLTIPGFGGGSAETLEESRLRVRWNGGWVGINPSSQAFREAFRELALYIVTLEGTIDVFAEGLFLDTFEGIVETGNWSSHLENTIEMKDIGTIEEIYTQVREDLVNSKNELESFLYQRTGNPNFRVQPNSADADYIYGLHSNLYNEQYRDDFMDLSIEFLVTTTTNLHRIPRFKQIYDDMDDGRKFFIRSQTNFAPPTEIPFRFIQFALTAHYLINHENAHFMYHYGNAGNYGGYPYGNPEPTHWHPNMEINIGVPIVKASADYWGITNTDRFYEFASGSDYQTLAREYTNALVIAQFGSGGWANIGNNPVTHQLDGEYYPLLDDNTNGPAVTSITLGQSEGVILLKSPVEILGINTEIENKIQIYPNPVKDVLTIANKEQAVIIYKIYNTTGQVVQSSSSFNTNQINISHLNSGIYFLKLISDKEEIAVKFIIE
ncbi:MAG: T9SS type A sorting domain-containing protein [Flavobacteriaceae bacterium]|nr:T9SS type A sorting domain-containing protein [Flavobacteriaceae bacterium]